MKKEKIDIEQLIKNNEYSDAAYDSVFKNSLFKSGIRLGFMVLLTILSVIFRQKIATLAKLTGSFFSDKNSIFGQELYFTFVIIALCLIILSFVLFIYFPKIINRDAKGLKNYYRYYNIADMIVFVFSTIAYVYFMIMFIITPCRVEGSSMNNTYSNGDRVIVWHLGYTPSLNDVVIFDSTPKKYGNNQGFWIKRVLGVEGTLISYESNGLFADGVYLKYIGEGEFKNLRKTAGLTDGTTDSFTIPSGKCMLIGDNRVYGRSYDSAFIGLVDNEDIIGKVILRFFPFDKLGNPKRDPNLV